MRMKWLRKRFAICVLALICVMSTSWVVGVRAAVITTQPALPLIDVAFCATPPAGINGAALFISALASCSTLLSSPGSGCAATGAVAFNVSRTQLRLDIAASVVSLPLVYWCRRGSGGVATLVEPLQMNVVQTIPMAYARDQLSTLMFNDATPVGTTLNLVFVDGTCRNPVPGLGVITLGPDRKIEVTLSAITVGVCATIASPVSGSGYTGVQMRNRLVGYTPFNVTPNSGAEGTRFVVNVSSPNALYSALSDDPLCRDLPIPTGVQTDSAGRLILSITKPRGTYYMCVAKGERVYYPASNMFSVLKYGAQPNTAYVGQDIQVYPSKDSTKEMQVALFASNDCSSTPIEDWASFDATSWNVVSAGTYYTCVRSSSSSPTEEFSYANTYTVVPLPTLTPDQSVAVRGFAVEATLTSASSAVAASAHYIVGLSDNAACSSLYRNSTVTAGTAASFAIGADAAATLHWCMSNPILSASADSEKTLVAVYVTGATIPVRDYRVSYGPLRTNAAATITLDDTAALPSGMSAAFVLVSQHTCADVRSAGDATGVVVVEVTSSNTLTSATFPEPGEWQLCVSSDKISYSSVNMPNVTVYGDAALSVGGLVPRMTTTLTISDLQPLQSVYVVDADNCSNMTNILATAVTDDVGSATVTVTFNSSGTLLVCSFYTGLLKGIATAPELQQSARMVSANPHVFPAAVELRAGTQALRVVTGGSSTLVDRRVFLSSPDTACPSSVTGLWLPDFAIVLPALQHGDQADAPTTTLTLNDNMMDTLYRACVETNNTYVDAGIIAVTRASLQAATAGSGTSPIALVADQLAALVFPSSFTSVARIDTYVVIEAAVECTGDISGATVYATGSISPRTGVADTFVAPTPATGAPVNLRVCVASQSQLLNSTYGFLDGGAFTSNTFTAVSAYAQRNLSGGVVGWPVLSYATLYLVRCVGSSCDASAASRACSLLSPQYPVSESTATSLRPSSGTHLLCQRVTIGSATRVVGSSTTVEVIEPYSMSSETDLNQLRTSVGFDVTVSGGPGGSVQLVVQPLSVPCGTEASESQSFALTVGVERTIAITTITAYQPIHFCAKPNSASVDAFEVMSGTLHSFASPSYISFPSLHSSGSVTVTMPTTTGLQAMLSRALDCRESIDGGALTFVANSSFTFTVPPCGANSDLDAVHFCELPGGIATYRGSLLMMRAGNCTASDNSAAIRPVSAAPGVPIADVGADTRFLNVAGISASPECSSMIAASVVAASGYLPSTEENAAFFVCTSPVGAPSVTFTTLTPTLTVRNFVVAPSMARSPVNVVRSGDDRTVLTLSSSLPPGYAFFSAGTNCVSNLGDAPGMNTSAASAIYSTLNQCGPVSVCWQAAPSVAPLSIARFTSLTTPTVRSESLAIVRGATFSATFASDRCSFMVSAGTRTVYLSADQCASVLEGTTTGSDMTTFTTNISSSGLMAGLSTASLCSSNSRAAGAATIIAGVPVARGDVYPTSFTTGMIGVGMFIPRYPTTAFWLSTIEANCTSASAAESTLPTFGTDASGYGVVNVTYTNGLPLTTGDYALCYPSPSGATLYLDTIQVVASTFFDVQGTSFVIGVASKMTMLGDLTVSNLLQGFSPTSDCSGLSSTYGTWSSVSPTAIEVVARRAPSSSGLFLCARVPANLSVIALPNAWSSGGQSIIFTESTLLAPSSNFDACTNYTLQQCNAPIGIGKAAADTQLTVVSGDCCDAADEAKAVGSGSMSGGTCSLLFDAARVRSYPANTLFSLCAWSPSDASVCATLSRVTVNTTCIGAPHEKGRGLSGGAVAGIIIACLIGGLALFAGIAHGLWYFGYCGYCEGMLGKRFGGCSTASGGGDDGDCQDDWSFGVDSYIWSAHGRDVADAPPEGNNYGKDGQLGVYNTNPNEMRRNVIAQLAEGDDEVCSLDSWGEPRDTNFMDGCEELTEKYTDFLNGIPSVDPEDIPDFPGTAFMRRTKQSREALFDLARQRSQAAALPAAADAALTWGDRVSRSDVLCHMERTNPTAKALYLLFEEQNCARTAIEISEDTALFNLRTLFKSHVAALRAKDDAATAASLPSRTKGDGSGATPQSVFATEANSREDASSLADRTPPPLPPAQAQEAEWLYNHRHQLEFPWVTNNFRTLVGYRKGDGQRYNYIDWDLPLLDLQAFHPLHRWWSPALPCVLRSAEDAQDARFAFMRHTSTVPFVKRYFMLFKVEVTERVQIETQQLVGLSGLRNAYLDMMTELDALKASESKRGQESSSPMLSEGNPLDRGGAALREKVVSMDSQFLSSDISIEDVSSESYTSSAQQTASSPARRSGLFPFPAAAPLHRR